MERRLGTGPNTRVRLQYRDASNYKEHTEFVLAGVCSGDTADLIEAALDEGTFLIVPQLAELVNEELPDPRAVMLDKFPLTEDDHCWVELDGLENTTDAPTLGCSFEEFAARLVECSASGWNDVDAYP